MIIKEWTHAGMECVLRHAWDYPCGYVAVPEDHNLYKAYGEYDYEAYSECLDVHGGVTFIDHLRTDSKRRWFIGFDMGHCMDQKFDEETCKFYSIRTDEECIAETNRLAEQLAGMKGY